MSESRANYRWNYSRTNRARVGHPANAGVDVLCARALSEPEMDTTPQIITALLALGMALAFIVADRQSPTSRMLAFFLTAVGVSIVVSSLIELPLIRSHAYPWWGGIFAWPEVLAFIFAYEWVLRVRRTIPPRNLTTRFADNQLRVAQALAVLYGVLALCFPRLRAEQFVSSALSGSGLGPGFFLFAVPLAVSLLLGVAAG